MIIREEIRDLFTVPQGYYLAHCISRDFTLGAGIAEQFAEIYNMREKLKSFCRPEEIDIGKAILIDNVFNLITKAKAYQKPIYDDLEDSLYNMRHQMKMLGITKLAIPQIGCGLDQLNWRRVRALIEDVFEDTNVEILICYL